MTFVDHHLSWYCSILLNIIDLYNSIINIWGPKAFLQGSMLLLTVLAQWRASALLPKTRFCQRGGRMSLACLDLLFQLAVVFVGFCLWRGGWVWCQAALPPSYLLQRFLEASNGPYNHVLAQPFANLCKSWQPLQQWYVTYITHVLLAPFFLWIHSDRMMSLTRRVLDVSIVSFQKATSALL